MSDHETTRVDSGTLPPPIDRRLAGKGKSIGNRQRFLRRQSEQVREAVKRAIEGRGIRDVGDGGEDVRIPKRDLREPVFGHGPGGSREGVHPGNEEYVTGDRIERPRGGQGSGGSASDSGEGEDDFVFHLTKEEFMNIFFDDLALPNLIKTTLADTPEYKSVRSGFTNDGTPNNLSIVHSMRNSIGRGIAFHKNDRKKLLELLEELDLLESVCHMCPAGYDEAHQKLTEEIGELETKIGHDPEVESHESIANRIAAIESKMRVIPYLDPIDLKYRARMRVPMPYSKAVMFCLMDISGSMDELRKDLSKRFFILLYLFLTRHYEKIDIVFIRHHTEAQEVTEEEFFHSRETGGTIVSSALLLMEQIIRERYPSSEWNIYGAQASDGDNWGNDSGTCSDLLEARLLPLCRYFAYIQVVEEEQNLWREYAKLAERNKSFAIRKVKAVSEIYPVFRGLFQKEQKA